MSDEELVQSLKDELGVYFVFNDVDILMEKGESVLEESKQNVTDGSDLQLRNFHVQKDAIMKYRQEKNFQLCQQEKTLLDNTAGLNDQTEALVRELEKIQSSLSHIEARKVANKYKLQSMEMEEMMHLKEHDENIQSLESVKKSLTTAVGCYNRFLGITIQNDAADNQRFYIEFKLGDGKADYKIPVTKSNDGGFIFPDGSVAYTSPEFITQVCNERKKLVQII